MSSEVPAAAATTNVEETVETTVTTTTTEQASSSQAVAVTEEVTAATNAEAQAVVEDSVKSEVLEPITKGYLTKKTHTTILPHWNKRWFSLGDSSVKLETLQSVFKKREKKVKVTSSSTSTTKEAKVPTTTEETVTAGQETSAEPAAPLETTVTMPADEYESANSLLFRDLATAATHGKGILYYYHNEKDNSPSGMVNLRDVTCIEATPKVKAHSFVIKTSARELSLCASSEQETARWIKTLQEQVNLAKAEGSIEESEEFKQVYSKLVSKTVFVKPTTQTTVVETSKVEDNGATEVVETTITTVEESANAAITPTSEGKKTSYFGLFKRGGPATSPAAKEVVAAASETVETTENTEATGAAVAVTATGEAATVEVTEETKKKSKGFLPFSFGRKKVEETAADKVVEVVEEGVEGAGGEGTDEVVVEETIVTTTEEATGAPQEGVTTVTTKEVVEGDTTTQEVTTVTTTTEEVATDSKSGSQKSKGFLSFGLGKKKAEQTVETTTVAVTEGDKEVVEVTEEVIVDGKVVSSTTTTSEKPVEAAEETKKGGSALTRGLSNFFKRSKKTAEEKAQTEESAEGKATEEVITEEVVVTSEGTNERSLTEEVLSAGKAVAMESEKVETAAAEVVAETTAEAIEPQATAEAVVTEVTTTREDGTVETVITTTKTEEATTESSSKRKSIIAGLFKKREKAEEKKDLAEVTEKEVATTETTQQEVQSSSLEVKDEKKKGFASFSLFKSKSQDNVSSGEGKKEAAVTETVEAAATTQEAATETAKEVTVDNSNALKTGFLSKQSQIMKTYDRRYFSLSKDGVLLYSKDDKLQDAKEIKITRDVVLTKVVGIKKDCAFDITTKSRVYRVTAESAEEVDAWISAITQYQETLPQEAVEQTEQTAEVVEQSSSEKVVEQTEKVAEQTEQVAEQVVEQAVQETKVETTENTTEVVTSA